MIWSSLDGGAHRAPGSTGSAAAERWDPQDLATAPPVDLAEDLAGLSPAEREELLEAIALTAAAQEEREAADEIERRIAEAYRRGLQEGREKGQEAAAAGLRSAVAGVEEALDEIRKAESRWRGGLEENICALAIAVAKQILERELRGSPRVVSELVRRAVATFPIDQPIRIRLAPSDLAMISAAEADGPNSPLTLDREARWIADPHIVPGGCVVEGRERIIDGRVDAALERLYRRLTHTSA